MIRYRLQISAAPFPLQLLNCFLMRRSIFWSRSPVSPTSSARAFKLRFCIVSSAFMSVAKPFAYSHHGGSLCMEHGAWSVEWSMVHGALSIGYCRALMEGGKIKRRVKRAD